MKQLIMSVSRNIEIQLSALNDLIRINNDRITGYIKRLEIEQDDDLEDLFTGFIFQGRENISELKGYIFILGSHPVEGECLSGKFYHSWMDFKATVTKQGRGLMLDYCENTEDVAKSSYFKLLNDQDLVWHDQRAVNFLNKQFEGFKKSHTIVKTLRDRGANAA